MTEEPAPLASVTLALAPAGREVDWRALAALIAGALLALALKAVFCGCRCCGKRLQVVYRSCCVMSLEDDQPEPLMAAHPRGSTSRFGPPPLRYQQPGCHQSRLPPAALHPSTIPARRAVAPANAVTPANDARAWNDLRDALGTSVPDLIVAQLLEEHSGDVGAAAQAYYATPRGAMSVGRNANGNLCRP